MWAATPRFKGVGPERIAEISNAEISNREIIDAIKGFYIEQAKKLEARLQDEFAPGIRVPVEKEAADVLYVPLVGEHALVPVAKILHAVGVDWTLSLFTATNHSLFTGDVAKSKQAAHWIVQKACRLGVKTLV